MLSSSERGRLAQPRSSRKGRSTDGDWGGGLIFSGITGRLVARSTPRLAGKRPGCIHELNMIRVTIPQHLRTLAHVGYEVQLDVEAPVTQRSVLDALEARYPMLRGTIRDQVTQQRRPFLRFFACEEDLSHQPPDAPLPEAVASGTEPFIIIGAIAGG